MDSKGGARAGRGKEDWQDVAVLDGQAGKFAFHSVDVTT